MADANNKPEPDDEMWPSKKIVKHLSDAIPKGEHSNPSNEFIQVRLDVVQEAIDHIDWLDKGVSEWRGLALMREEQAKVIAAMARLAVGHLQAVLNNARTHHDQQAADTAARDWLESIGQ